MKDDGFTAYWGLSEEPAEEVKRMWSRLFPGGRDISVVNFEFPSR